MAPFSIWNSTRCTNAQGVETDGAPALAQAVAETGPSWSLSRGCLAPIFKECFPGLSPAIPLVELSWRALFTHSFKRAPGAFSGEVKSFLLEGPSSQSTSSPLAMAPRALGLGNIERLTVFPAA